MGVPTSPGRSVIAADVPVDPATRRITVARFSSSAEMVPAWVSGEDAQHDGHARDKVAQTRLILGKELVEDAATDGRVLVLDTGDPL